jgi:hypothetical protein
MTQEQKEILLKDLCARLPYGVICEDIYGNALELNSIDKPNTATFKCSDNTFWTTDLDKCKPYLFPLSSMTEEQKEEWKSLMIKDSFGILYYTLQSYDYLYKNHIDIRGFIDMGLANDATGKNIY